MHRITRAVLLAAAAVALTEQGLRYLRRINFTNRSVIITGGSRGLGLLMARMLAAEGAKLTLIARDGEALERAQAELSAIGAEVQIVAGDIADPATSQQAVALAAAAYGSVDVVINNAGIIQAGPLSSMTRDDFDQAMDVHFWGAYHMIMAALPHMQRQGAGRIVNISSIGGGVAVPHLLPYSASKYALVGLSDGMRAELAKDNIRVTTVLPGLMRTGSHMNALFKGKHRQEFTLFSLIDSSPLFSIDGREAARQIIQACRYGQPQLTITWQAQALILANNLVPNLVAMGTKLASRFLPQSPAHDTLEAYTGWESQTPLAPSGLTSKINRATLANNEFPS